MRPLYLSLTAFLSISLSTGCATGLSAEARQAALVLPKSSDTVRVRILLAKRPARLDATGPFQFQAASGGKIYSSNVAVHVRAMRKTLVFDHKSFKGDVRVLPVNATDILSLNGRRYRGGLTFHSLGGGRFDAVESVELQEYLYGVLPREVETDWPLEALKAQAVVSRTYALSNKSQDGRGRFDLVDGVFDQVYGGMEVEAPLSNRAVDETKAQVLVDSTGHPIQAFFHSSCGGRTELPQHVWKSSSQGDTFGCISDTFCQEDPHYTWRIALSFSTIRQRMKRAGVRLPDLQKILIVKKSDSGRVEVVGLQTSRGVVEVSGNKFRLAMGADTFRSTLFTNLKQDKKGVVIDGHGWGHGVGLCQWGAYGRAKAGQTYDTILKIYYPKAILKRTDATVR